MNVFGPGANGIPIPIIAFRNPPFFHFMTEKLEKIIRGGRELTAHVSHELRSPLARIRVTEELLKDCIERGDYADDGYRCVSE